MSRSIFQALAQRGQVEDQVSEEIRQSTRKRLRTMLKRTDRQDVELNSFDTGVQTSGRRGGDSVTDDAEAIRRAAPLDRIGAVEMFPAKGEESNDVSLVEEMTNETDLPTLEADGPDQAGQRAAVAAFQAAVSEARQAAVAQLTAGVERIRKKAADQQTAELARVTERHAEELKQVRENAQAEATAAVDRARQEESDRHAAELACVRENLERQCDDDLQHARTAVVESFNALMGSVLKGV